MEWHPQVRRLRAFQKNYNNVSEIEHVLRLGTALLFTLNRIPLYSLICVWESLGMYQAHTIPFSSFSGSFSAL